MFSRKTLVSLCATALLPINLYAASIDLGTITTLNDVDKPDFSISDDGDLYLTWRHINEGKADLYLSRLEGHKFSPPLQVNDIPAHKHPLDDMRPAIDAGPNGLVAVAWTTKDFNVRTAISQDYGQTFLPSVKVNQTQGDILQEFIDIDFSDEGTLHAVWIDSRRAGPGTEEPADLYYASIVNGVVKERNLTEGQESSICGCCRPNIENNESGQAQIAFRNTTQEGYRDIFTINGSLKTGFEQSQPVAEPLWKTDACPMSGPIVHGGYTLWNDMSTGKRNLMAAKDKQQRVVLTSIEDWNILRSPRTVQSADGHNWVYIAASPHGRIIAIKDGVINELDYEIPDWVTSAAIVKDQLLLVGFNDKKHIKMETRSLK